MTAGLYAFLSRGGGNSGRGPAETSGHQKKNKQTKKQQNINTIKKMSDSYGDKAAIWGLNQ